MFGFGRKKANEPAKKGHYYDPNAAICLPVTIKQIEDFDPFSKSHLTPDLIIKKKKHLYFGDLDENDLPHGVGLLCFCCEDLLFNHFVEKFNQKVAKEKKRKRSEEEVLGILGANNENFNEFGPHDKYGGCWVHGSFHGEGVLISYSYNSPTRYSPPTVCTQSYITLPHRGDDPSTSGNHTTVKLGVNPKVLSQDNKFSFKFVGSFQLGRPQGDAHVLYGKNYTEPLPVMEKNPAFYPFFFGKGSDTDANSASGGSGGLMSFISPFGSSSGNHNAAQAPAFYKETLIQVASSACPKEYFGEIGGGQFLFKHGKGMLVFNNGDVYEGDFVFNVRHGQGKLQLADKSEVYEGSFERNKKNGQGTLRLLHLNNFYKGNFIDNIREGEGVMRFSNGDEYLGSFKNNNICGFGVMKYKNGDVYEGEWRDNMRNGAGNYSLKKSNKFIVSPTTNNNNKGGGSFKTVPFSPNSDGMENSNNNIRMNLKGNFINGLIQGEGRLEITGQSLFVGNFIKGERSAGTIFYGPRGDPRMDYLNDTEENKEEKENTDGMTEPAFPGTAAAPSPGQRNARRVRKVYQGEWDGENFEGKGLLWYSDGSFYCGNFHKHKRHGVGNFREIRYYPEGENDNKDQDAYYVTEYSGFFHNDCKQGWGIEREEHIFADFASNQILKVLYTNLEGVEASEGVTNDSVASPVDNRAIIEGLMHAAGNQKNPTESRGEQNKSGSDNDKRTGSNTHLPKMRCGLWHNNKFIEGYVGEWDGEHFSGLGTMSLTLPTLYNDAVINTVKNANVPLYKRDFSTSTSVFLRALQEVGPFFYSNSNNGVGRVGRGIIKLFTFSTSSYGNSKEDESAETAATYCHRYLVEVNNSSTINTPAMLDKMPPPPPSPLKRERKTKSNDIQDGETENREEMEEEVEVEVTDYNERKKVQFFGLFLKGKKEGAGMLALPALGKMPGSSIYYPNTTKKISNGRTGESGVRRHIITGEWKDNLLHNSAASPLADNNKNANDDESVNVNRVRSDTYTARKKSVWVFPTGEVYYGSFRNGMREDPKGVLLFTEGSIYIGPFKDNQPCGKGLLLVKNTEEPVYKAKSVLYRDESIKEVGKGGEEIVAEEGDLYSSDDDESDSGNEEINGNPVLKTVGALFSVLSFTSGNNKRRHNKGSNEGKERKGKHFSASYLKYVKERRLVAFRSYYILIANWETGVMGTTNLFNNSDNALNKIWNNNSGNANRKEQVEFSVLDADNNSKNFFINTSKNTLPQHSTSSAYNYYRNDNIQIPFSSTLKDALDILNKNHKGSYEQQNSSGNDMNVDSLSYFTLKPPATTIVSKTNQNNSNHAGGKESVMFFLSSGIITVFHSQDNLPQIAIPFRPFSFYDSYIMYLSGDASNSTLGNKNFSTSGARISSFAEQSFFSEILLEYYKWIYRAEDETDKNSSHNNGYSPYNCFSSFQSLTERYVGVGKRSGRGALQMQYHSPLSIPTSAGGEQRDAKKKENSDDRTVKFEVPKICCVCGKEFSFFRRAQHCSLCYRAVCSSCLSEFDIPDKGNNANKGGVSISALMRHSHKFLQILIKIQSDVDSKKNSGNDDIKIDFLQYFPSTAEREGKNAQNDNTNLRPEINCYDALDGEAGAAIESIPACPSCAAAAILLHLEFETIFIPARMLRSVLSNYREHQRKISGREGESYSSGSKLERQKLESVRKAMDSLPLPADSTPVEDVPIAEVQGKNKDSPDNSSHMKNDAQNEAESEKNSETSETVKDDILKEAEVSSALQENEEVKATSQDNLLTPNRAKAELENETKGNDIESHIIIDNNTENLERSPLPRLPEDKENQISAAKVNYSSSKEKGNEDDDLDNKNYVVYKGYLSKGIPHLLGQLWWNEKIEDNVGNKTIKRFYYCGGFYQGKRSGFGTLTFVYADKQDHKRFKVEKYIGNFKRNFFDGDHNYYIFSKNSYGIASNLNDKQGNQEVIVDGNFSENKLQHIHYYGEAVSSLSSNIAKKDSKIGFTPHGKGIYFYYDDQNYRNNVHNTNNTILHGLKPFSIYNGEWRGGERHGSGLILSYKPFSKKDANTKDTNGEDYVLHSIYRGSHSEGTQQGLGMLQTEQSVYIGGFFNNKKHGTGTEFFYNKNCVELFYRSNEDGVANSSSHQSSGKRDVQEMYEYCLEHGNSKNSSELFFRIYEATFQGDLLHGFCREYNFYPSENSITNTAASITSTEGDATANTATKTRRNYEASIYESTYHRGSERDDCFDILLSVDDSEVSQCGRCNTSFGLFTRRHHCRLCGGIYCASCSGKRARLPPHFYTNGSNNQSNNQKTSSGNASPLPSDGALQNNNNNANTTTPNNTAADLQRVCEDCFLRLEQRRQMAVKTYFYPNHSNKELQGTAAGLTFVVYAGCWSHGKFVGRGLYYRSDGLFIVMNPQGRPLLPNKELERIHNKAGHNTLVDQSPSREVLNQVQVSSTKADLEDFLRWWSRTLLRCGLFLNLELALGDVLLSKYRHLSQLLHASSIATVTATANNSNIVDMDEASLQTLKTEINQFLNTPKGTYTATSILARYFSSGPKHMNISGKGKNGVNEMDIANFPRLEPRPISVNLVLPPFEDYAHIISNRTNLYSILQRFCVASKKESQPVVEKEKEDLEKKDNDFLAVLGSIPEPPPLPSTDTSLFSLDGIFTDQANNNTDDSTANEKEKERRAFAAPTASETCEEDQKNNNNKLYDKLANFVENTVPLISQNIHHMCSDKQLLLLSFLQKQREERFLPFLPPPQDTADTSLNVNINTNNNNANNSNNMNDHLVLLTCYESDPYKLLFFPPTPLPPPHNTNKTIHFRYYDCLRRTPSFDAYILPGDGRRHAGVNSREMSIADYYYTLPLLPPSVPATEHILEKGKIQYASDIILALEEEENQPQNGNKSNNNNINNSDLFEIELLDVVSSRWNSDRGSGDALSPQNISAILNNTYNTNKSKTKTSGPGVEGGWLPYPFDGPYRFSFAVNDSKIEHKNSLAEPKESALVSIRQEQL